MARDRVFGTANNTLRGFTIRMIRFAEVGLKTYFYVISCFSPFLISPYIWSLKG
jgi:hypothetical protein